MKISTHLESYKLLVVSTYMKGMKNVINKLGIYQ